MVKAEEIFEIAMALMDSLEENSGRARCAENSEYEQRTLPILNSLIPALRPYSRIKSCGCERLMSMDEAPMLDEELCRGALPYGLAAALLIGEDSEQSLFCQRRFNEMKEELRLSGADSFEDIEDVYGGFAHNDFSRW